MDTSNSAVQTGDGEQKEGKLPGILKVVCHIEVSSQLIPVDEGAPVDYYALVPSRCCPC
jgi:hypothetical protein